MCFVAQQQAGILRSLIKPNGHGSVVNLSVFNTSQIKVQNVSHVGECPSSDVIKRQLHAG